MMNRVTRGEAAIAAYVDAVIERDSYQPREGEEQTEGRDAALKQANARMKLCYAKLNGGQLGEARRRLATIKAMREGAVALEEGGFFDELPSTR
jgi:hypothetical protein